MKFRIKAREPVGALKQCCDYLTRHFNIAEKLYWYTGIEFESGSKLINILCETGVDPEKAAEIGKAFDSIKWMRYNPDALDPNFYSKRDKIQSIINGL